MNQFALGLDFGTESARAVLVDVRTGETISTKIHSYSEGVIDERLPGNGHFIPPDWALQNPDDWLTSLQKIVQGVLRESQVYPGEILGIGVDFTSSTLLPTLSNGIALCMQETIMINPMHDRNCGSITPLNHKARAGSLRL